MNKIAESLQLIIVGCVSYLGTLTEEDGVTVISNAVKTKSAGKISDGTLSAWITGFNAGELSTVTLKGSVSYEITDLTGDERSHFANRLTAMSEVKSRLQGVMENRLYSERYSG